ncbi:MAG: flagellar protein [Lachnospiraceae bacterium]|nr:flagellar protein [Lachnospiraceae bacterium]
MDVRNCRGCGRLFNYLSGPPLCPDCVRALDDKFQQVKEYVYDHRNASIQEVADENDVSVQQLRQWVREERLEFSEASLVGLSCESCGAMIRSGRFCKSCKDKLANTLGNAYQKPQMQEPVKKDPRSSGRMRFLDS